jgi:hypothetical protein
MSDDPTVVESAECGEGIKHWRLLRRPCGFYLYEEMTFEHEVYLLDEEGNEGAVIADGYWTPTHVSGLFDSSDAARQDAVATLLWLRAALPTGMTNGS